MRRTALIVVMAGIATVAALYAVIVLWPTPDPIDSQAPLQQGENDGARVAGREESVESPTPAGAHETENDPGSPPRERVLSEPARESSSLDVETPSRGISGNPPTRTASTNTGEPRTLPGAPNPEARDGGVANDLPVTGDSAAFHTTPAIGEGVSDSLPGSADIPPDGGEDNLPQTEDRPNTGGFDGNPSAPDIDGVAQVRMAPDSTRYGVGDRVSIGIQIQGGRDVGHTPFHLQFDPRVLRFDYGEEGAFLGNDGTSTTFFATPTPTGDSVVVGLSRLGRGAGIDGNGGLCVLHFTAVGPGAPRLNFAHAKVRDGSNRILQSNFEPNAIVVE